MRGSNLTWGRAAMVLSATYLIKRFLPISVPMNIAIVFITLTRDSPLKTPTSALRSIGVPNFPGLKNFAEYLYLLSFGIWFAYLMDTGFTHLTPNSTASYKITSFLQRPKALLDLVNPSYLPTRFHSRKRQFWSRCWHPVFKSALVVTGGKPLVWITKKLSGKTQLQGSAGLIGIYLAYAMQHGHLMPQFSHSSSHTITSLTGFEIISMLQPLAVLLEPTIIRYMPKRLRQRKVWNSLHLLATTYSFGGQYSEEGTLSTPLRPLSQWSFLNNAKRQNPLNRIYLKKDSRTRKTHSSHNLA